MNKLVKGSIAGAAGIALLLGGAGTLALWNDTATVGGSSAASGELTLATTGTPTLDVPTNWVPGDEATYTTAVTVVATGDNIKADLTVDSSAVTGDQDFLDDLDYAVLVTAPATLPAGITYNAATGVYSITTAGTYNLTVKVTVTFDEASDNSTQDLDADLTGLAVKVQQTV